MILYVIQTIALFIGYFILSLAAVCALLLLAFLAKGIWRERK